MKKIVRVLCLLAATGLATSLYAADEGRFYLKFDVGGAFPQDMQVSSIKGIDLPASATVTGGSLTTAQQGFLSNVLSQVNLGSNAFTAYLNQAAAGMGVSNGVYSLGRPKIKLDPGVRFDLAGGYMFNESLSLELETGLVYNSIKEIDFSASAPFGAYTYAWNVNGDLYQVPILANLVYTFNTKSQWKPFLGAGVGGVESIMDLHSKSYSDFQFAYQAMAGIAYEVNKNLNIGISYKFLGTLDHNFSDFKTDGTMTHAFVAQLTYKF
jgi:opacity protein-like surface antigen